MNEALVAAITALITALAAYVKAQSERNARNAKDLNAVFPKIRSLEDRIAQLETGEPTDDSPRCLTDCRKEA